MLRILMAISVFLGIQLAAHANSDAVLALESLDTTESWGLEPEFNKKSYDYYYKCCAVPKNGGGHHDDSDDSCDGDSYVGKGKGKGHGGYGCVFGDSRNMYDAKSEALRSCYSRYHKSCYIRFCKKQKRH